MIILAIETTEKFGSVALLENRGVDVAQFPNCSVLAEVALPKDKRSSQTLHPALRTLFETTQTAANDVHVVAVVAGPGSFTGLRVGVTAAKVFAYSVGAKVIALDTFRTVAAALPSHCGVISVGVDAQRGEVVATVLRQTASGQIETVREPELISVADWWKHSEQYENVLFAGPALERWDGKSPPHIVRAADSYWFPTASIAGRLAAEQLAAERLVPRQEETVWSLLPVYSRLSAAEEKRNAVR